MHIGLGGRLGTFMGLDVADDASCLKTTSLLHGKSCNMPCEIHNVDVCRIPPEAHEISLSREYDQLVILSHGVTHTHQTCLSGFAAPRNDKLWWLFSGLVQFAHNFHAIEKMHSHLGSSMHSLASTHTAQQPLCQASSQQSKEIPQTYTSESPMMWGMYVIGIYAPRVRNLQHIGMQPDGRQPHVHTHISQCQTRCWACT